MIFIRRSGAVLRYTALRVGLFFLAAGIWLAGIMVEDDRITIVAIGVVIVAILVGAFGRLQARRAEEEQVAAEAGPNEE
jgi:di/tricarboxylate transporter